MTDKKVVSVLVMGGEATAGAPLGPQLGPLGVNVLAIVNEINKVTGDFKGMRVPVKIEVDTETKGFGVSVGTPTTSALVVKEAGVPKGSGKPNTDLVGNVTFDKVLTIAKVKMGDSYAKSIRSAVKEVVGSCVSMGVKVENQDPRAFQKEVEGGKWDKQIAAFESDK
ncbi:MAG: 50S ribosomal protein L11 [Nitrososphaerota archaeon]|jgi:large subunit ribosomal protein L11|nr:50S ribosomal protein L11 [Nitrososphaerota archaeon]MDG6966193.1 50S ribosomal protein L11 [Nitrososphaerota archaeon]MDG6968358.1 50S ribosomal protein L11 [Nitrososphaerota archaeon]MDG6977628.1 50S ribosomal protein L11 [Nitrososphaerota archaeon]MDG7020369.1 50S ribosomal protein L11 [Nitrososphaerota archaeon]